MLQHRFPREISTESALVDSDDSGDEFRGGNVDAVANPYVHLRGIYRATGYPLVN